MKIKILWLLLLASVLSSCAKSPDTKNQSAPLRQVRAKAKHAATPKPKTEPIKFYLYIPKQNGGFEVVTETDSMHVVKPYYEFEESVEAADQALRRLLKKAPDSFPPGTKMFAPFMCDGRPTINLNRAFRSAAWWKDSMRGKAALYALANTAVRTKESTHGSSDEESLRFLVEGKPLGKIGVFDLSRAVEPDYLTMIENQVVLKYK